MTKDEFYKSRPTTFFNKNCGFSVSFLMVALALGVLIFFAGNSLLQALEVSAYGSQLDPVMPILTTLPWVGLLVAALVFIDHFVFLARSFKHERLLSGKDAPTWVLHQDNSLGRRYLERELDGEGLKIADLLVRENFTGTLGELVTISKDFSTP